MTQPDALEQKVADEMKRAYIHDEGRDVWLVQARAVIPVIREQIAQEIEALMYPSDDGEHCVCGECVCAYEVAATTARGETP